MQPLRPLIVYEKTKDSSIAQKYEMVLNHLENGITKDKVLEDQYDSKRVIMTTQNEKLDSNNDIQTKKQVKVEHRNVWSYRSTDVMQMTVE